MLTDIRHLQQIGVQAGLADDALEQWLVGAVAASRYHHPIQPVFFNRLLDLILALFQASVIYRLNASHAGQAGGEICHRVCIHDASYAGIAATYKDTHVWILSLHVSLWRDTVRLREERVFVAVGPSAAHLAGEQTHHVSSSASRVQDCLRDFLWRRERATDVYARLARLQRCEFVRRAKAVGIQFNPQHVRQVAGPTGRQRAHREHHHVEPILDELAVCARVA